VIGPVFRTGFLNLVHSRVDLLLTFLVPIAFFTVFTLIFERGVGTTRELPIVIADEGGSAASRELSRRLGEQAGLRLHWPGGQPAAPVTREAAEHAIRGGFARAAIVIPPGWPQPEAAGRAAPSTVLPLEILLDTSDPIAGRVIQALLVQEAAAVARGGPGPDTESLPLQVVDLLAEDKSNPIVAVHAAGIAVMFLLFGAVGAAGTLIDEEQTGTLERLLTTRASMTSLLLGKWLFLTCLGVVQVTAMFAFGQAAFDADLTGHLPGFGVMTIVTAMASSSFALLLAAACRSRAQLNGVAIVVVLCMSALGGSMIPRYVMSDELQQIGLLTFNAWALDGYMKVFWLELPLVDLAPQAAVLGASALVLFGAARALAGRWQTR
jgi:ABC-2 type transport system permease protein